MLKERAKEEVGKNVFERWKNVLLDHWFLLDPRILAEQGRKFFIDEIFEEVKAVLILNEIVQIRPGHLSFLLYV